jgi:hypothetical protein
LSEEEPDYPADDHVREIVDVEINPGPSDRDSEEEKTPTPSSKRKSEYTEVGEGRAGVPGRKGMILVFIK